MVSFEGELNLIMKHILHTLSNIDITLKELVNIQKLKVPDYYGN